MRTEGPQISTLPATEDAVGSIMEDGQLRIEWNRGLDVNMFTGPNGLDVSFRIRVLADCLVCILCGGFFRNATTIKECLHTFCRTCVLRHLISRRSACPKCGISVEGNILEGCVFDNRLQNLVDKLFPFFKDNDIKMANKLLSYIGKDELPTESAIAMTDGGDPFTEDSYGIDSNSVEKSRPQDFKLEYQRLKRFDIPLALSALKAKLFVKASVFADLECPMASTMTVLPQPNMIISGDMPVRLFTIFILNILMKRNNETLQQVLDEGHRLQLWLEGRPLADAHTLEFACRSRRFAIGANGNCVPIQYKFIK